MQNLTNTIAGITLGALVLSAATTAPQVAFAAAAPATDPSAGALPAADDVDLDRGQRLGNATGVGGGLLIGGLVGGPIGAAVGAGLGSWLGSRVARAGRAEEAGEALSATRDALAAKDRDLQASLTRSAELEGDLRTERLQLAELAAAATRAREANDELRAAIAAGLELQVMFRTGQSTLTDASAAQLAALAEALTSVRGLAVRLDAYADPRGAEDYNASLAAQRAQAVREALLAGGLGETQVASFAHGEAASTAPDGDVDAYALERRVDVSILSVRRTARDEDGEPADGEALAEVDLAAIIGD